VRKTRANEQVLSVPKNVRSTVVLFADTAAAQQGEQDETAFALSLFHSKVCVWGVPCYLLTRGDYLGV